MRLTTPDHLGSQTSDTLQASLDLTRYYLQKFGHNSFSSNLLLSLKQKRDERTCCQEIKLQGSMIGWWEKDEDQNILFVTTWLRLWLVSPVSAGQHCALIGWAADCVVMMIMIRWYHHKTQVRLILLKSSLYNSPAPDQDASNNIS